MNISNAVTNDDPHSTTNGSPRDVIMVKLPGEDWAATMHLEDWLCDDHPMPPYAVSDMLMRGSMYVLAGDGGIGKSYLAMDLAYHIGRGLEWMGREVEQGAVLYVDQQNGPYRMATRYKQIMRGHNNPIVLGHKDAEKWPLFTLSLQGVNFGRPNDAKAWNKRLRMAIAKYEESRKIPVRLVIIDSLLNVSIGADENNASDMGQVIEAIRDVASKMEVAILVIHHTQRNGKVFRGTGEIKNGTDGLFSLEINSSANSAYTPLILTTDKLRDGTPIKMTFEMRWAGNRGNEGVDFIF